MAALTNPARSLRRRLPPALKAGVEGWLARKGLEIATRCTRRQYVALDYPPSSYQDSRWDPHPRLERIISSRGEEYRSVLALLADHRDEFARIPVEASDPQEPGWHNGWQPGLDSGALYAFLRRGAPSLYLEVGSGNSTKFARRAIRDGGLATQIVSIDPSPRAEVDVLCDRVIRAPLEGADLSAFGELTSGDVVFFDGSHRIFTNSDATVFFLEILPQLSAGVLVAIHDIYLPYDYPEQISDRYYSEQYLLAAYLLAGAPSFEIVLPAWYVSVELDFRTLIEAPWARPELAGVQRHGTAFWLETRS